MSENCQGSVFSAMLRVVLAVAFIACVSFMVYAADYQPPLKDLRMFSDVYAHIKTEYVEEVEDKVLIEGAIRGMMKVLDPYSVFLTKKEFSDLKVNTTGKFGGLGIEVAMEDGLVKVISPIDDSPAAKVGLLAGDLIAQIDDDPVKGMSLSDAVSKMRGPVGTKVTLVVIRGDEKPFEVQITRKVIKVKSVKNVLLDDEFGYIRITKFQTNTPRLLSETVRSLQRQGREGSKGQLKGLILDLRSNPGGVLNAAVEVSDIFLEPNKLVVYTQGRQENSRVQYMTKREQEVDELPVVVLINGGSASASEIVAGALQDHHRAKILGTRSFGKGSVQTVHPLDKLRAIKLTTAKYYTPRGRSIHDVGVMPDLVLEKQQPAQNQDDADKADSDPQAQEKAKFPLKRDLPELLKKDFQVQRAIREIREASGVVDAQQWGEGSGDDQGQFTKDSPVVQ